MKSLIRKIVLLTTLLLTIGAEGADAQRQYFGFKGGWGEGDVRLYPHWTSPPVWGKLNGGFFWVYYGGGKDSAYLADNYTGGVCVEVELLQRGFQYAALDRNTKKYTYRRAMNTIMVPVMWQPHALLMDERLRIFLNAGATLSYNLDCGSKEYYFLTETGELVDEYDYEWISVRDNRWGYGLVVGLGAGWRVADKWEIMSEFRYYFGYSDIVKRKTIYLGTQFLRSPLDNINLSLGVAYSWGHSGSWSFGPAKRKAMRAAQQELLPSGIIESEGGSLLEINNE